jgi:CheY-like chemotaxis protein
MINSITKQNNSTFEYLKSLTLLCVEDDKNALESYKQLFGFIFKDIIFAYNGEDGYEKYCNNRVDIIMTDYSMPKKNGLEMIEMIRKKDKNIPIILATAIDNINIISKIVHYSISNILLKPLKYDEIIGSLENCSKILIANKYLKDKEEYNSYQEDLGFKKELNILRNDFYYQMLDNNDISLLDFLYQPLDVMSGDAYSARRINKDTTFYLVIDGMGKGLSASLTAMIMTSFVNHVIDSMIRTDDYDFALLIDETTKYIRPILLDEEALAIDYIEINNEENQLYYAKFAMPVLLMENEDKEIIRIKSNNPPLSKWQNTFNINSYDITNIKKFLIYSDGIVENETIYDNKPYADFIEDDFLNSFTRENLKRSFFAKVDNQEDDITLIYIHKLNFSDKELSSKTFNSTLADVEKANQWYVELWKSITNNIEISSKAETVFTELFMNAHEHGNLGINSKTKHFLINQDTYFDTLLEKESTCTKKITVKISKIKHRSAHYIITQITDEGEGFDTQILSEIFRNSATFNGRGVFISRKNSLGIYYNNKGTSVLYLNKV